jgi:hypothetical protein
MRSRWIGAAIVVSLGLALGGVAGASTTGKPALPKKTFIKTGDNICKQTSQLVGEAAQAAFGSLKGNAQPSTQQLQSYVDNAGPIYQQEVDSLRALPAPKADAKKLNKIFTLVQKGYDKLTSDPSILLKSKKPAELIQASKLAKAYGFKVCGQG